MLTSFLVSNWSDILYLYVLFSEVCFFIGMSEAIEVISSLVGNKTAILFSFKPQFQHKKPNSNTHTKNMNELSTETISQDDFRAKS